eukprot:CAMPEP_0202967556 /NCGR_PEP_ID=MMETSP1396-20130829/12456_1 /ASSEMBLY_ACC=CAM_ASM_000872 /TAXON_ID= /ORGANISM="Pseudokeronopsis sp., Strain Brazil" /LENGTH=129 /DNA_ID=CAMNT_0049692711 /DNA_START=340 /DNA_END=726 /DNA_ORIENTATION=+
MERVSSKSKYELWARFSLEKVMDGCARISKAGEAKKEVQLRQLELEVGRLNAKLEMAGEPKNHAEEAKERVEQMAAKENELRMNILAYKDLVERKNEEIQMLQEQIGRMRNSSIYNTNQRQEVHNHQID